MKQKKKIKRKLLSFLLTLAIAIGLVPGMNLTVHAETQVNQVDYYYNEGMTLKTISAEFYDDNSLKSFSATYEWGWGSVKQSLVLLDTLLVCDYDSYANSYARDDYGESFCNYEDSKNYVLTKNPGTNFVAESENPDNATPIVNGSNTKTLELSKGVVPSDVNKVYYLFLWTSKAPDDEVYPDYHLATVIVSGGKVYLGKENTTPSVPTHTVTFDTQNHGVAPANQSVGDGDKVTKPTDPTAEGFTFGGWYKEEGCTTAWNFESDTVTANTTLYAKWIEPAKVKTSPTPKEDLTYNGKQQELLNGGTSENGTMKYALGADSTTVPTSGWGIYIPKATNADTYYVWYKVVGDENHTDTNPVCITVDIDTKTDVSAEQKQGETLTYDGTAKTPTIDIKDGETKVSTYTVKYVGVEPTVYEESETAPTEAGNYKAVVTLNGNYSGTKEVPFTVSPKSGTNFTAEQKQGETLTYDGTAKTPTIDIKDGETEISTYTVKYVGVEPTTYEESETAPTEAGNYKAVVTLKGNYSGTKEVPFTVSPKPETEITVEQKQGETLTYDGTAKTPTIDIKDGETEISTYTVKYVGVEPTVYEESETAPTEAGNYKAVITLNGNYSGTKEVPFIIDKKAAPTLTDDQKPTAKNNLSYKGEPQEIVNAPIELPDDYIGIQYAIGSETGPTGEYTTFIPEATDAGTYFVWYKLIGDENHKDTEPVYIMVTIKQVDLSIKTEVNTSEDASYIKVDNLNDDLVVKLLTDEEKRKYEVGNPVIVYLDITALDKADVPAEDMTAIEKILNSDGYSYGECLDLSLWKKLGEGVPTQIHDTNGNPIKITITIPELLKNVPEGYTRTYAVVRLHNGISTKLAEGTGATLEISTDKFSSYFIIFKDVKNSADDKKQDKSSNADTPSNVNTTATVDTPKTADTQKTDAPKTENTNKGNKISTGDKINIGVIVMLMMDSVMAGVYLTLRRKLM
ncbi:MAG: InlB B-repeat-containing protein [Lachnospiraceae bacterium]|nr:InlB B-repeat-containing protein [Lachnospiraceae bacterium]